MALSTVAQWVYNRIMGTRANADATGNHAIDRLVLLSEIAQQIASGGGGGSFDPHSPGVIGDVTPGNATFDTLTVNDEANFSGTPNFNGNDVTFNTPTIAATWRTKLDVPKADTVLLIANNFTDVGDPDDCRTNLDVYSKAEVDALPGVNFDPLAPGSIGTTTPGFVNSTTVNAAGGNLTTPSYAFGGNQCGFYAEAMNVVCTSINGSKKWTFYDGRTVSYQPLIIEANKSLGFGTTGDGNDVKGSFVKANNGGPNNNPVDQVDFTTNGDKVDDGGTLAVLQVLIRSGYTFANKPDPTSLPNGVRSSIIDAEVAYSWTNLGQNVTSVLSGGGSGTMPIITSNGVWIIG